jgi:hypothetical protein
MIALVYNPTTITDPEALASSLGIGALVAGIPPAYTDRYSFPDAGYFVVRETWAGLDVLPGPVTVEQIAALPDPGPNPAIAVAEQRAAETSVLGILSTTPIDMTALTANLAYLSAFLGNATVVSLAQEQAQLTALIGTMVTFVGNPAPTLEQAVEAIKAVCESSVVVQRVTLSVLADTIRYTLQRS